MKKKLLKGSLTIEMSFLIPFIMFLFMWIIFTVFYFHDKNILNGAAYETAAVGSVKMREREKVTESELEKFCVNRLKGKCIFLTSYNVDVKIGEESISVKIHAKKKKLGVTVEKKAALTEPEKKIRNRRR